MGGASLWERSRKGVNDTMCVREGGGRGHTQREGGRGSGGPSLQPNSWLQPCS